MPDLAVVGIHQAELDAADQARAVRDLAAAIDATGVLNGLTPAEVAGAIRGREQIILSDGLLGPGRRLLADGRNLYNQAQPEGAIPVLEQAVASLTLGQAAANDTKDLWEAWVYLGTSLQAVERVDEAEAAYRAAVALNPGRSPSAALFPPPVVEAYAAAREALAPHAVTLQIDVPGDATIYVDGEQVGVGTASVPDVYPGEHHVLALGNGVQAHRRVTVPMPDPAATPAEGEPAVDGEAPAEGAAAAGPATMQVRLTPAAPSLGSAAESAAGRAQQTAAVYRALGEHARSVELILLAGTEDNLLHLQLYSPSTDAFSKPMGIPFDGDADDEAVQTVPLLVNLLDKDGRLPPSNASPLAVALDVGANSELAGLLTHPPEPVPIAPPASSGPTAKKGGSKVLPIVLGAVGVAALGSGTYFGVRTLSGAGEPPNHGTIIVGPY